ncbi:hypothetical protein VD0002_g2492 [Verticillium dahliae]|uniref:Uncharacterized protein n=1 Tax=Verticillium dahliae TaxID=27337 RepID=A0A2J8CFT7_VERDA|nr:hypothetical protein BJF96_g1070 [Verticillium dahliae]PNH42878.1 hypothetical protein VD0004_g4498 [Verticillium dahliae]PNH54083.1 hypothetical protein VD0003_g3400 [Verticillium dahliae]PNH67076.1 hypothetical protein VD0002_g2492 [Verticillium dahliae]PNH73320.1 hypothetical protein VD0001_g4213 [Verticillium dahliae]
MAGFGAGLVVGFFSQAIVFVSGLAMLTLHVVHRWGVDIPELLGLRQRLSRVILNQPFNNAVFRLSFAATFTLAAFARF